MDELIDFTAGALGGVTLVYVGQPLDTVKVKMQTYPQLYGNMFECCKKVYMNEGIIRGLYAGTVPAVIANVAENSVLFAAYGSCQKLIQYSFGYKNKEDMSLLSKACAGSLASFFSAFTLCPTELIKCKLQAMQENSIFNKTTLNKKIGPFQLTKHIIKQEGIFGLFRGLTSTIAREMPGYFFFFGSYEGTRQLLTKPGQNKNEVGLFITIVSGAVGGTFLWLVIFPADVIKSRIQIQNNTHTTFTHEFLKVLNKEGIGALYSGLVPTLVRTIPATAALFVTYEYSKLFFNYLYDDYKQNYS